jgi:hypothetical protein
MLASSVSLESVAEILGGRRYFSLNRTLHLFMILPFANVDRTCMNPFFRKACVLAGWTASC